MYPAYIVSLVHKAINRSSECREASVYGGRMWHMDFGGIYDDSIVLSMNYV
jgi:hypothetical protein